MPRFVAMAAGLLPLAAAQAMTFRELGCFNDRLNDRVFSGSTPPAPTNMTKRLCAARCEGFPYYGVEDGSDCWCGDYTDSDFGKHGRSTNCTTPCSGNANAMCGGRWAIRAFSQAEPHPASVMCVNDDPQSRLFQVSVKDRRGLSPESCMKHCLDRGYFYAGTQGGEDCWCGSEDTNIMRHGAAIGSCATPCSGDPTSFCGGPLSMNVFKTGARGGAQPTISPVPLMTIPTACQSQRRPTFRYANSSGVAGRLYAEGGGCFTMTDLYNFRGTVSNNGILSPRGPIYQLDDNGAVVQNPGPVGSPVTNKWLLAAELYITDGSVLYCRGSDLHGGDCDELRIQSTGPTDFHTIRGHGGSMYFENTIVTSWDTPNRRPQMVHRGGRSFLNCVSEKIEPGQMCDGRAKADMGECRMDIINSEMGYMGYFASESYGLTWKVRGFCKDLSNPEIFDTTNVYGDIIGSDIHHMYYGHYSYGHQGGVWTNNTMRDNIQYGFDPHDDSDYIIIAHNEVYNNGNHGIIASKRCNDVHIYDNNVRDGGAIAVGIFLHRSSDNALVYNNTITNMKDSGIAMLESMGARIYDNVIDTTRFGIRQSLGSANNMVYDNSFNNVSTYGLYTYQGSDPPTRGVSNGRPKNITYNNNRVTDTPIGVKFKDSDTQTATNNLFTGTTEFEFFDAQDTFWSGNTVPRGTCVDIITSDDGMPVPVSTFTTSNGLPSLEC